MTSKTGGILVDAFRPQILVYFEMTDLIGNLNDLRKRSVTLLEVVRLMNNMAGIRVKYRAIRMPTGKKITYAAHKYGLTLDIAKGKYLPRHLKFIVDVHEKEHSKVIETTKCPNRVKRFEDAERNLSFRNRLKTYDDLKRESEAERKTELIAVRGRVRVILNENFALLWGPLQETDDKDTPKKSAAATAVKTASATNEFKHYCLFDTFDLHLANNKTAAEKEVKMSTVLKVGDEVTYNACLIDEKSRRTSEIGGRSEVPYLATAVWWPEDRAFDIPPIPKASIQPDKINVYEQVIKSCEPFIEKQEQSERDEENEAVFEPELRKKREEEAKQLALEKKQKEQEIMRRCAELKEREELSKQNMAKMEVYRKAKEAEARGIRESSSLSSTLAATSQIAKASSVPPPPSSSLTATTGSAVATASSSGPITTSVTQGERNGVKFDLVDWKTKGRIESEKCDLFAILKLWNGKRALVSTHRVWIHDKPKFGEWKPLYMPYFSSQMVNARQVTGFEDLFEYQVIFCHSGMFAKQGLMYEYSPAMAKWISALVSAESLNAELNIFRTRHVMPPTITKSAAATAAGATATAADDVKNKSGSVEGEPLPPGEECK